MSKSRKFTAILRSSAAVAALSAFIALPLDAQAGLWLRVNDGASGFTVSDAGHPGLVGYIGSIGNFTLTADGGTGYPLTGSPSHPVLDLTSLDVTTGKSGGTLKLLLTQTGFTGANAAESFLSSLTGNYLNSAVHMTTYLDNSNAAFGKGTLLSKGLFDNEKGVALASAGNLFSLTEIITINAGAFSLTSLDALIDAPEPASLSLLGVALLGLGALGWRRRRARSSGLRAAA